MPQVYFNLAAEDLEAVDYLAERDFDGNRSEVLREAVADYLTGRVARRAPWPGYLLPDPDADRATALRAAHAQVRAYRLLRLQLPARLELLDREYQRWRKRVQRGLSAEVLP